MVNAEEAPAEVRKKADAEAVKKAKGKEIPKDVKAEYQNNLEKTYHNLEVEYRHAHYSLNRMGQKELSRIKIPPLSKIKTMGEIYVLHNSIMRLLDNPEYTLRKPNNEMRQPKKETTVHEGLNMTPKSKETSHQEIQITQ